MLLMSCKKTIFCLVLLFPLLNANYLRAEPEKEQVNTSIVADNPSSQVVVPQSETPLNENIATEIALEEKKLQQETPTILIPAATQGSESESRLIQIEANNDIVNETKVVPINPSEEVLSSTDENLDEEGSVQPSLPVDSSNSRNGRQQIYDGAVGFANMLDRFFGENSEFDTASYDYLRLVSSMEWHEGESIDYRPRVKAKVHLPKIDKKFSLLFEGEDDVYQGEGVTKNKLSASQRNQSRSAAAVNYESEEYDHSKFDTRVGLDSHIEPFALVRHTFRAIDDEKHSLKNFNSIFWREKYGSGASIRTEYNRVITEERLFRWKYSILRAEKSDGNEWRNSFSIVNHHSAESWISYDFDLVGRSAYDYDVEYYRLAMRYRQQLPIQWLYFEIEPEFQWLRTPEFTRRKLIPGITLRFEIQLED